MNFQGSWDAATNSPAISDAGGSKGQYYVASVAGTQNLGSGSLTFAIGDWAAHNGTIFQKIEATNLIYSVFSRVGVITAQANDYTWAQIDKTLADIADIPTRNHGDLTLNDGTNPHGTTKADVVLGNVANVDTTDAGNISSGVLAHERGGLEADASAYDGLVKISGGGNFRRSNRDS